MRCSVRAVLAVLSPHVLGRLDVAVTIALAVLGVLVGVALGREIRTALRLFVAASLESAVTIAAVTGATIYFVDATGVPLDAPVAAFALALGLCASASSATSADPDSEPAAGVATRVADLDDVAADCRGDGRASPFSPGAVVSGAWLSGAGAGRDRSRRRR